MDSFLMAAIAEKIMESLNRTALMPYCFSDTWNPQSNNWHTVVNHQDTGSGNPIIYKDFDVFVGRIEVINQFTEIKWSILPYFLTLDYNGNEMISKYGYFSEMRQLTEMGFAVYGAFGGMKVVNYTANLTWLFNYSGYLIKRA